MTHQQNHSLDKRERGHLFGWFDAHCHFASWKKGDALVEALQQMADAGVSTLVDCTAAPDEWQRFDRHSSLISTGAIRWVPGFGAHPWYVEQLELGWDERLDHLLQKYPQAVVGEAGLDWRKGQPSRALQLLVLERQWQLARRWDRPLALHSVRAGGEWPHLVEKWGAVRGQLHGFAGSPELAQQLAKRGFWFSVGRGLLQLSPDKGREIWKALPSKRRMIETDRSQQQPEANLARIGEQLALQLAIPLEELKEESRCNGESWLSGALPA